MCSANIVITVQTMLVIRTLKVLESFRGSGIPFFDPYTNKLQNKLNSKNKQARENKTLNVDYTNNTAQYRLW